MGRESAIVTRILQLSEKIGSAELMFTNDCSVGELLSDDPFAFLLAASIDRGMVAETAWRLPGKIRTSIGHLDPSRIASMSVEEMLNVLNKIDGRPRYLGAAAQTLIEVSKYVTDQCAGDARELWRNQSAKEISRRLTGIYGIGPGISAMVLNLLNRAGEITFSPEDLAGMDPKPDVHLRRVLRDLVYVSGNHPQPTSLMLHVG